MWKNHIFAGHASWLPWFYHENGYHGSKISTWIPIVFLRVKSLLNSRRFTKWLFIAIVIIHFLIIWPISVLSKGGAEDLTYFLNLEKTFLADPSQLYAASAGVIMDFLNLPVFIFYVLPWYIASQWLGMSASQTLIAYGFSMILWNLVNCFLIYKIINTNKVQAMLGKSVLSNPFILLSLYMGSTIFVAEYSLGNQNSIVAFFLLLGIFYFLNDKEHYAFFIWGIGTWFKLILSIFVVVIILHGPLKRFVKNAAFYLLAQVPNVIMFMLIPNLLHDYIDNLLFRVSNPLSDVPPVNIVQYLHMFYNVNITTSYIFIFCSLLPLTAFVLIECKESMNFFDKSMIITLLSLNLIQGEPHHVIITLGVYLIWIATENPRLHGSIRYLKIMLGIPFLSGLLWWFFPYNPIILFSALIWLNLLFMAVLLQSTIHGSSHSEGNIMEKDGIEKISGSRNGGKQAMRPATKILYALIFCMFAVMDIILLLYYFIPPFFSIP